MFPTKLFIIVPLVAASAALAEVPVYGQCGGLSWTGETACAAGSSCVFQNDYYSQCIPSSGGATSSTRTSASSTRTTTSATRTTTSAPSNTVVAPPAGVTTKLPASAGYTALPTASVISSSFDGHMVKFDRAGSSGDCQGQKETGEEDAVFILQPGASISNVVIGKAQAEGIHCRGPCTVTNVWWEDVCEDAITIKQTGSGDVSTINGGGAFHAEDKIVQHNGAGLVRISNFFASDFGKLYRACGNCATHYERHVQVNNVCLQNGKEGVGINTNWGDTAVLSGISTSGKPSASNVCCAYKGVNKGSEPSKIGCGESQSACQFSQSAVGSC